MIVPIICCVVGHGCLLDTLTNAASEEGSIAFTKVSRKHCSIKDATNFAICNNQTDCMHHRHWHEVKRAQL